MVSLSEKEKTSDDITTATGTQKTPQLVTKGGLNMHATASPLEYVINNQVDKLLITGKPRYIYTLSIDRYPSGQLLKTFN